MILWLMEYLFRLLFQEPEYYSGERARERSGKVGGHRGPVTQQEVVGGLGGQGSGDQVAANRCTVTQSEVAGGRYLGGQSSGDQVAAKRCTVTRSEVAGGRCLGGQSSGDQVAANRCTVSQSEVAGGRCWPIQSSGGQAAATLQVNFETDWGKPVKGKEGIVGWMRSHEPSKKVSDILIIISLS